MDKLTLPTMGWRTWFTNLVQSLTTLDRRFVEDGFSRDYVLTNGLSRPNGNSDLGINHFKIGDLNIAYGWGQIKMDSKQYQTGQIHIPYTGANYRTVVGRVYTSDGDVMFDSFDGGQIGLTPMSEMHGTYDMSFIMVWSEN